MSNRVYLVLDEQWDDLVQEVGCILLSYLEYRLGITANIRHTKTERRTIIYIICESPEDAQRIYNTLSPNIDKGVFVTIRTHTAYYTAGHRILKNNSNQWHDRFYRILEIWLRYQLEHMAYRCERGYGWELSEAIKPLRPLVARA